VWSWHAQTGQRTRRYYHHEVPTPLALRGEEAAEELRYRLRRAVRRRLPERGPVASMLSGGLDSSVITAELARAGAAPRALSMVLGDAPGADEGPWQRALVERYGLQHHRIAVLDDAPDADLAELRAWLGSLGWGPILALRRRTLDAARGARIWFDGYEGDVVIGYGLGRFASWWRRGPWGRIPAAAYRLLRRGSAPSLRRAAHWALAPVLPAPPMRLWRRLRHGRGGSWPWSVIDPAFARGMQADRRLAALDPPLHPLALDEGHERAASQAHGGLQWGLEAIDILAARAGARSECPFFDLDVVDWCRRLPPELVMHGGWTRLVLRQAARGVLPDAIRARPGKGVLGDPFAAAVRRRLRDGPANLRALPPSARGRVAEQRWDAAVARLLVGGGDYLDAMDWWLVRGRFAGEPGGP